MMKLLAGVEEVTRHCEKESNNGQLHNNNSHEKQSATELAQEASKPLVNKVSRCLGRMARQILQLNSLISIGSEVFGRKQKIDQLARRRER